MGCGGVGWVGGTSAGRRLRQNGSHSNTKLPCHSKGVLETRPTTANKRQWVPTSAKGANGCQWAVSAKRVPTGANECQRAPKSAGPSSHSGRGRPHVTHKPGEAPRRPDDHTLHIRSDRPHMGADDHTLHISSNSTWQADSLPDRAHARTKRNDFPVGVTPQPPISELAWFLQAQSCERSQFTHVANSNRGSHDGHSADC